MILVTLKPWQKIEGINHVRTLWEVSDTERFENILETLESNTLLESYFSNIFIPVGSTYYVRATRIFNTGDSSVLDPIPVVNYGSESDSMLLSEDTIIDMPFVYINKEDVLSDNTYLNVTTSEFRCNSDDHGYTHWIITDGNGDILYCNLYDKVNLTSIQILNDYTYKNKTKLNFIAIHGSLSCIESPVGKKVLSLTANYNFEVNNGMGWVEPLKDFKIVFTPIDTNYGTNIFKVELLDYATETVLATLDGSNDEYVVPFYYLLENMRYKIKVYAYDLEYRYGSVIKILETANATNTTIRNPDYEYKNKLEEDTVFNPTMNNTPLHSEAMLTMQVLVPRNDLSVEIYESDNITLKDSLGTASGLKVLNTDPSYTLIKPVTKGMIIMDTPSATGTPTFMVYTYSNHDGVFTFKSSLERPGESTCLGKTNNTVQISSTEYIYNPVGTKYLRIWDITTNTITKIMDPENNTLEQEIPLNDFSKGIMLRMGNNAVLLANGGDYRTKIFDYGSKTYRNGINFGPNSFIGADLRVLNLINGNSLIVKTKAIAGDTEGSCVMFDYKNMTFTDTGVVFGKEYPDITMVCGYGHCHMAKYLPEDKDTGTAERFDTITYI